MAYDRADWHYGGDFPKDLPPEAGGTHIGMFLAWVIARGLEGEELREDASESLRAVRERRMTGREFLMQECDEKLVDFCLNKEGNAFAQAYYERDGPGGYVSDYAELFVADLPSLYHVEDAWANYDRLAAVLDQRFAEWRRARS
jgi:hypothetical protein